MTAQDLYRKYLHADSHITHRIAQKCAIIELDGRIIEVMHNAAMKLSQSLARVNELKSLQAEIERIAPNQHIMNVRH